MNKVSVMATSERQLFFYSPEGVAFIKQGSTGYSVLLRAAGQVLAQRDEGQASLGVTDRQGSVLRLVGGDAHWVMAYTPYGRDSGEGSASLLRFNGQRKDAVTGHYLLGNGYRAFSPIMMRFVAPDSLSPFGAGGINAYGYCGGDPVNRSDPSGHMFKSLFGSRPKSSSPMTPPGSSSAMGNAPAPMTQKQANQILTDRLRQHNESVVAHRKTFKGALEYLGRDTNTRIDNISQADSVSYKDHAVVEATVVSLLRDSQSRALEPGFKEVVVKAIRLERDIVSALPIDAKNRPDEKWPLNAANQRTRTDG